MYHSTPSLSNPSQNNKTIYGWMAVMTLVFLVEALTWWPGILRSDSLTQFSQAQTGFLSDHHPPIMAFLWHYLNFIYPGSGSLLIFNLCLFCGSIFVFGCCVPNVWKLFFVGIPFFPPVFSYSGFILKDVGFTFSYLLIISILTFYTVQQKKIGWGVISLIIPILFYGTAVKYQAVFLLPFITLWMGVSIEAYQWSRKALFYGLGGAGFMFALTACFNSYTAQKDYAWQYVKLYDLAAISLITHQDLLPDFTKKPNFSMEKLSKDFNSFRVDELVFESDSILAKGKTEEERTALWHTWFHEVTHYPQAYLSHRWLLMKNLLSLSPIKPFNQIKSHTENVSPFIKKILMELENIGLIKFAQKATSLYPYIPLMIFYIFVGLFFNFRKYSVYAFPLAMSNIIGLALVGVLFIFSMAAEARYVYLSVCCLHLSHLFAFLCFRDFLHCKKSASCEREALSSQAPQNM